ncbi:MAG: transporter substrate-binding domain-containing protein [Burkholderiaceae bacterium]
MQSPTLTHEARAALLPTGRLRASINLGNPVLASRNSETGEAAGVSVDMARAMAQLLDVELELVVVDTAKKSFENVSNDRVDIGFVAIDPERGQTLAFSAPYILIEGAYLVREASPLTRMEEVDRADTTVVVGAGSAYDLYLSREIKHATLVRAPTSPAVVATFLEGGYDVAAGVKQQLDLAIESDASLRLLPGSFMQIAQAMAVPKTRAAAAQAFITAFVEAQKASGFVSRSLIANKVPGAVVAPPAG